MELYTIPFRGQFIIYRPLCRLAFLGNRAMVRHIRERTDDGRRSRPTAADAFLAAIDFWQPDPPPPEPWVPAHVHRPTMAVLLMTSACNLRCTYCYARGGEDARFQMNLPLARQVIDRACENARMLDQECFALAFHGGGEPTVNWQVLTAAVEHARAKELRCEISMSTNGVWSERQRRFIIRHFDQLSVSFDGVREVQDRQRPRPDGGGSFAAVMENVHALDEVDFPYGIRLTLTPESFDRLGDSVSFLCEQTKCRVMQVEPSFATRRGEYADPTREQAEAFVRPFLDSFRIASAAGRTLFYSGARPWLLTGSFCRAPADALIVTPEGDVVTCFETHDRRHPLISNFLAGRVAPEGVEVDLPRLRRFAAAQAARRSRCEGCFCYWHCGGDCSSRCLRTGRDRRDRCLVNREITRELLAVSIAEAGGVWRGQGWSGASLSCTPI